MNHEALIMRTVHTFKKEKFAICNKKLFPQLNDEIAFLHLRLKAKLKNRKYTQKRPKLSLSLNV